jgi:hypothetical protein
MYFVTTCYRCATGHSIDESLAGSVRVEVHKWSWGREACMLHRSGQDIITVVM